MSDNNPYTNFRVVDKRSPETQARAAKMANLGPSKFKCVTDGELLNDLLEACQHAVDRLSYPPFRYRTDQDWWEELARRVTDEILPMLESVINKSKGE